EIRKIFQLWENTSPSKVCQTSSTSPVIKFLPDFEGCTQAVTTLNCVTLSTKHNSSSNVLGLTEKPPSLGGTSDDSNCDIPLEEPVLHISLCYAINSAEAPLFTPQPPLS
ncbi:hypothetical protein H1C71_036503, partial [Ictidomys tridecemlineatus]